MLLATTDGYGTLGSIGRRSDGAERVLDDATEACGAPINQRLDPCP